MTLKTAEQLWIRIARATGFALTFAALAAYLLHPSHVRPESGGTSDSHCMVCHTAPIGASAPESVHTPALFVAYTVAASIPVRPFSVSLTTESPRGPPAA